MFYNNNTQIDEIRCTVSPVDGLGSGKFRALFEREFASLEQIEAIRWNAPQITGDSSLLPEDCGYQVDNITYDHSTRTYHVSFHMDEQYLGDVSGYQERVESLEADLETAQANAAQAQEQVVILAGKAVADGAEARTMRMAIETAVISLPDEQAAETPSLSQPWTVGEAVEPGDRRYYAPTDLLYKVRDGQGHTTQENWTPDKTPAMWAVVDVTHAGTVEDPIPAAKGMDYIYGKYYRDPEDSKIYLCKRTGEEDGGIINLQYLPHELIGQYFEAVEA